MEFYQKVTDIFDILLQVPDQNEKYIYIIDLGKKLVVEESIKDNAHLIKECASAAYIKATITDSILHIIVDSDSFIVRGLLYLLKKCFNNEPVVNVENFTIDDFIKATKLELHVTSQRMLGFAGALKQIQKEIYKYKTTKVKV